MGADYRQQQILEEYQQWLADPIAQAEYQRWLDEKGNHAACECVYDKETKNGTYCQ